MMTDIPLHSRVALKNGADNVYVYALAGTEGWVRDSKIDDDGFELVRVEWDKDHWRYNGQPDGWTFANHFSIVGPPAPPQDASEEEEAEVGLPEMPASEDEMERYMETLTEAMEAASEAEGFIIMTIRRVPNPENPSEVAYMPSTFSETTSKEAEMLLDVQVAEYASNAYQQVIFNLMQAMKRNE